MADDPWREWARSFDPSDVCPCGAVGKCCFASDFKVMGGKHRIRACVACKKVWDNGKEKGPLDAGQEA